MIDRHLLEDAAEFLQIPIEELQNKYLEAEKKYPGFVCSAGKLLRFLQQESILRPLIQNRRQPEKI